MIDVASLTTTGLAFFIAAASPGPATIAIASVSMKDGRQAGLSFGFGLAVGLAFWGLIAATGLGAILQASSFALAALKLVGGTYLIWLTFKSAVAATKSDEPFVDFDTDRNIFKRGLLLNLSNPKAVFAWMAVLALGLGTKSEVVQVALATGLCMALGIVIYTGYALIFSTNGAMLTYRRLRRWIEGTVASLFGLAGLGLIRSAFVDR